MLCLSHLHTAWSKMLVIVGIWRIELFTINSTVLIIQCYFIIYDLPVCSECHFRSRRGSPVADFVDYFLSKALPHCKEWLKLFLLLQHWASALGPQLLGKGTLPQVLCEFHSIWWQKLMTSAKPASTWRASTFCLQSSWGHGRVPLSPSYAVSGGRTEKPFVLFFSNWIVHLFRFSEMGFHSAVYPDLGLTV